MLSNTRRSQTDKRAAKYPKMCPIQKNLWPAIMLNVMLVLSCMQLQVESAQQLPELSLDTELRSARLMRFLGEPIQQNFNRQRRVGGGPGGPRVRPSVDNLNRSPAWRSPLPPPVLAAAPPQIRREFNNNWPYNGNNNNNAATRFAHAKDAPVLDVGKNQFYRIKDGAQYNYHANQYTTQSFKASQPNFEQNKHSIYTPIQQYAIPVEANKYLNYADSGSKQNPTQTLQNHNQLGQTSNSYAVYEDTENGVKNPVNLGLSYQQTPGQQPQVSKEAESYLHFMSTNDYFLPRRDPNYKQLDAERDQQLNYQQQKLIQKEQLQQQQQEHKQQLQLQQQQQQQQQQLQLQQLQQQQQQVYRQAVPQRHHTSDSSVSSSYNKPLRVSDLFFQQDPAPPSSAVVRGSYQAGQNAFVVKSDGNKSVKHILSTTLSSKTTQSQTPPPPLAYTKSWYSAHKTETPEPLRFEFTEHDAIKGSSSYTNAPKATKYYYETRTSTPRTVPTVSTAPIPDIPHSVKESQIVVESKDTHNTDFVNKRPQEQGHLETPIVATDSAETPKDNEALCEKICANVYDENDEIVCGSDGYMYTGESQLECYSSCLNIEVSIKSKGSCA